MTLRLRHLVAALALVGLSACSSSTPTPPTPTPDAPSLTCPASASLISLDGAPVPYSYEMPTAVNGAPPVPVTCSRLSGSNFSPGSTIVTCTATDALSRQASCNFNVTVTVPPKISKTRFLAMGDSITFGRCGPRGDGFPVLCEPYTVRLEELLRARYTQQTFSIVNVGISGQTATDGEDRLPGELNAYNPEVLLLMMGTNDINNGASAVPEALESLEDMVVLAQSREIVVYLATVAPITPGGANNGSVERVVPFNSQVRNIAARRNVPLVDVYTALNADLARYYHPGDDLHPLQEGHRLIGETFYTAIRETLDITPGPNIGMQPARRAPSLFTDPRISRSPRR